MKIHPSYSAKFIQLLDRDRLLHSIKDAPRLLVAVSGGADSVVLLCAIVAFAMEQEISVGAVHVNHGLRQESAAEAGFVEELCARLAVPCHVLQLDSDARGPTGGSAEAHWRGMRYAAFADIMRAEKYDRIALGHTADDLAETFLFHLVRGTGVDGLTFQFESDRHGLHIIRPLWKTGRADIEAALRNAGQPWMDDSSNQDTRHRRNLIRHKIMPLLREINPDATGAIVRASEAIGEAVPSPVGVPGIVADPDHESSIRPMESPAGTLSLGGLLGSPVSQIRLNPAILEYIQQHGGKINSRQIEQARRIILSENSGLVSLADSNTLVITRQFAWIISRREPSTMTLAAEHCRRFGGITANIGLGIRLNPDAFITGLDGIDYHVKCSGAKQDSILANRVSGAWVGNTPLKKILNQLHVPWYLREWQVYIMDADGKNVLALLAEQDSDLDRAIRRHSRAQLQLDISRAPNRA